MRLIGIAGLSNGGDTRDGAIWTLSCWNVNEVDFCCKQQVYGAEND